MEGRGTGLWAAHLSKCQSWMAWAQEDGIQGEASSGDRKCGTEPLQPGAAGPACPRRHVLTDTGGWREKAARAQPGMGFFQPVRDMSPDSPGETATVCRDTTDREPQASSHVTQGTELAGGSRPGGG